MSKYIAFFIASIFLAACAGHQTASSTSAASTAQAPAPVVKSDTQKLTVVYSARRQATFEPCGCPMAGPRGGVEREWNFLHTLKTTPGQHILKLSSGTAFIPTQYSSDQRRFFERKAGYMLEAMNGLGYDAFAPGAEDLFFGVKELVKLQKKAHFPFLSANLYLTNGKRLFVPYKEFTTDKMQVVVVGLTSAALTPPPGDGQVDIKSPVDSLKEVLASLDHRPHLLIILSSLAAKEKKELESALTEPAVILGGSIEDLVSEVKQVRGNLIESNPDDNDRELVTLDFNLGGTYDSFYGPGQAKRWEGWTSDAQAQYNDAKTLSESGEASQADRELAQFDMKKYSDILDRAKSIPLAPTATSLDLVSNIVTLDSQFANPPNPMTKLIAHYRRTVHDSAVKGN